MYFEPCKITKGVLLHALAQFVLHLRPLIYSRSFSFSLSLSAYDHNLSHSSLFLTFNHKHMPNGLNKKLFIQNETKKSVRSSLTHKLTRDKIHFLNDTFCSVLFSAWLVANLITNLQ